MAENEVLANIPLRNVKMSSRRKRTNFAVEEIRKYVIRHMKVPKENVWIDPKINELLWTRGIEKPPSKLVVKLVKFEEEETVEVLLPES